MFGSFRRHQKWIWILGVVVIIPSFVIFFSPDAKLRGGTASRVLIVNGKPVTINGQPIPMDEFNNAYSETLLGHFFRANGKWPESGEVSKENLEHDAIIRVFMLQKLKDLDINVSEEAVARLAMERLGTYPLASLERDHLITHGLNLQDFDRFMRHEVAIQQLVGVVTSSAKLIKPQEAEILYRKDHEEVAADLAVFWASNYLDKVTVTPTALATFYTNHMSQYRVPERVQVSYVEFGVTNYLAEAAKKLSEFTNYTAQLEEAYAKRDTNSAYFKGTNGAPLDEAAAKAKLEEDFRHHEALVIARRRASEFGNQLISLPQPQRADNLEKLAASNNLPVKITPPFDYIGGLDDTNFPTEFREKALKLTRERPILFTPVVGEEAVYLISLKNKIPSENPPFEKVQDKVTADFKNLQAWDLARTNGNNFASAVTNGLVQKKSFAAICEENHIKPLALPPFSSSTPSLTNLDERINFYMVQRIALSLKPGEASPFYPLPRQEGGLLFYLRAKLPLDEAKVKTDLPEYIGRLRMYRQNEDFNQWFSKQAELAKLNIPRKETPGQPGS